MKKAERHFCDAGLYEILRQPLNITVNPCQFKMLQRTKRGNKVYAPTASALRAAMAATTSLWLAES